ncbi:MAG: VOC family protein [Acidimicrobiales bacterium]
MPAEEFPSEGMALTAILVVADVERAARWYEEVLGATPYRSYGGTSAVFSFQGAWLLLVTGGGPTADKPTVAFAPPADPDRVDHAFTIRVPDCRAAYDLLRARGAAFLTPPVDHGAEIRGFLRDPDGHLFELSQVEGVGDDGLDPDQAERHIASFIEQADQAGDRPTAEVAAEVAAVVAGAWADLEARTAGLPTNGLIAAMLEVGRQARRLTPDEPEQWQLHAAGSLLSGLIGRRRPG